MNNKGKQFEMSFRENWKKCFPNSFIFRLNDQISGYKITSQNPCDVLCFTDKKLFLVECKSHDGASIPFAAMPQYERMLQFKDCPDVYPGFVIWFKEKDIIVWVDINVAEQIYNDGNKSIQLKMLEKGEYDIVKIPTIKKRIYLEADYSILPSLYNK